MAGTLNVLIVVAGCLSAMGCCKTEEPSAAPKEEAPAPLTAVANPAAGAIPGAQDEKLPALSREDAKVTGVEFAVSWNAKDSEIKTAADAVAAVGIKDKKPKTYEVLYYPGLEAPEPASAILRERNRTDKGKEEFQLMHKIRSAKPVRGEDRKCVLASPDKDKYELDVSVMADGVASRYSYSCTEKGAAKIPLPASVTSDPTACSATMLRYDQEGVNGFAEVTVEQWTLGDGSVFVEVSAKRENADADPGQFRELVKSLDGKIVPLAEGMTQQVRNCAEKLKTAAKP